MKAKGLQAQLPHMFLAHTQPSLWYGSTISPFIDLVTNNVSLPSVPSVSVECAQNVLFCSIFNILVKDGIFNGINGISVDVNSGISFIISTEMLCFQRMNELKKSPFFCYTRCLVLTSHFKQVYYR